MVGGFLDADGYSIEIDGWKCEVGAHYQDEQYGPYGGKVVACSDMGSHGPLSDRLRDAFQPGSMFGIVPGVVDPDGVAGARTSRPR